MHSASRRKIAALVYSGDADPAPVLEDVVAVLRKRGVVLAGAIQHGDGSCAMALELLPSGLRIPIWQDLGSGASGCRLDTTALAEAAAAIRKAIETSPSLAVFNKFGSQEAAGSGLRDEIAAAAANGVPVLTAVRDKHLEQWTAFTGGESVQLPCSAEAALAWWDALSQ